MGREIRRVPVDFQHPVVWLERRQRQLGRSLDGGYEVVTRWTFDLAQLWDRTLVEAEASYEREKAEAIAEGTLDEVWTQEDLERWQERIAETPSAEYRRVAAEVERDLGKHKWRSLEEYLGERPSARAVEDPSGLWRDGPGGAFYQPSGWPPPAERGYVVYQTVGEGSPITPCFPGPVALVDWLSSKGTAWDPPCSREAAARFVAGGYLPTVVGFRDGALSGLEVAERAHELARPPSG